MKVLVVDNGTHYKKRLLNLVNKTNQVTWVSYDELDPITHANGFDLIVLSGAYKTYDVKNYADTIYAKEKELIRMSSAVIIGICLGAQLIAYSFGAKLTTVSGGSRIKGVKRIWNVKQTPFDFFLYHGGRVWASQKWRITELPGDLEAWCASGEGVEVFRHREKSIYGLQFHPEYSSEGNDGRRIFEKIIEIELANKE